MRCYILDAFQGRSEPGVLPLIEAGLSDSSPSVRGHAVDALLQCRAVNACGLLLPLLNDRNAVIRCRAFAAAVEAECRGEAVAAALLGGAGHPDWRIRQAAARSLRALGIQQAADLLYPLSADPRNAVRVAAREALERLQQG